MRGRDVALGDGCGQVLSCGTDTEPTDGIAARSSHAALRRCVRCEYNIVAVPELWQRLASRRKAHGDEGIWNRRPGATHCACEAFVHDVFGDRDADLRAPRRCASFSDGGVDVLQDEQSALMQSRACVGRSSSGRRAFEQRSTGEGLEATNMTADRRLGEMPGVPGRGEIPTSHDRDEAAQEPEVEVEWTPR